jgi:hypothetical protein
MRKREAFITARHRPERAQSDPLFPSRRIDYELPPFPGGKTDCVLSPMPTVAPLLPRAIRALIATPYLQFRRSRRACRASSSS